MGQLMRTSLLIGMVLSTGGLLHRIQEHHPMERPGEGTPLLQTVRVEGADAVAADETTTRVFVVSSLGSRGTVRMFDARSALLLRTTRVGPFPLRVTVDATGGRVFVSSNAGTHILDARTGLLLRTLRPGGVVVAAQLAGRIFICSYMGRTKPAIVRMLDARTSRLLRAVRVGLGGCAMGVAERAARVFVSDVDAGSVSILDARTGALLRTVQIRGAQQTGSPAVDERDGHVFIATGASQIGQGYITTRSDVSMLDARTGAVLRTTPVNRGPMDISVDTRTSRVFVTTENTIDVLDARTGALVHSTNVDTAPASAPVVNASTGHVVVLLASPTDDRTGQVNGPGVLLALDGSTGAVRQHLDTGSVLSFGLTDLVAADARAKRVFVLDGKGLNIYDGSRL